MSKSYIRDASGKSIIKESTNDCGAKYNGLQNNDNIKDKTFHCSARPGAKEKVRNINRGINKKARQLLKRDLDSMINELDELD